MCSQSIVVFTYWVLLSCTFSRPATCVVHYGATYCTLYVSADIAHVLPVKVRIRCMFSFLFGVMLRVTVLFTPLGQMTHSQRGSSKCLNVSV